MFRCFIALYAKYVDLGLRKEKTQKYSKGLYLICYGHEPTKGSHCPKYRLGARSENSLCPDSSLCYQNRAKAKTKNLLNLVGFVGCPVFDSLYFRKFYINQTRILKWVAMPPSRGTSRPGTKLTSLITALTYFFPDLEPVCCSMSGSNCCFLTCLHISQEAGKLVWYSHLFKNFPQFEMGSN